MGVYTFKSTGKIVLNAQDLRERCLVRRWYSLFAPPVGGAVLCGGVAWAAVNALLVYAGSLGYFCGEADREGEAYTHAAKIRWTK